LDLIIGGVAEKFLIDSGATTNVIPRKTFDEIRDKLLIIDRATGENEIVMAYGKKRLKIDEIIWTIISTPLKTCAGVVAKFLIIDEIGCPLLGHATAVELGVLRIGYQIFNILTPSLKEEEFPKIPGVQIELIVDSSVKPVRNHSVKIPLMLQKELNEMLDRLERRGVIRKGNPYSEWCSRIDLVQKSNGSWRLVQDLRWLNLAIIRAFFPLPNLEYLLSSLIGAAFFTVIDMSDAYWHLELKEESKHYTTFMTTKGPYEFNRLPQGISCAPEIFQATLTDKFKDCNGIIIYMDDILIYGKTQQELKTRQEKVFRRIKELKLSVNLQKCKLNKEEVTFLGKVINKNGRSVAPERVEAIRKFQKPKTKSELKSFVGLVKYLSESIPACSRFLLPLNELTKNNRTLDEWGAVEDEAFEKIKKFIEEEITTNAFFDPNPATKTKLFIDAGPKHIAAVLVQNQNGVDRIISCNSRTLTETEQKYPQPEKETLAAAYGSERNDYYLLGRKFEMCTDLKANKEILSKSKVSDKRSMRRHESHGLRTSMYRFDVVVIPSEQNIADPFSRMQPVEVPEVEEQIREMFPMVFAIEINDEEEQQEFVEIQELVPNTTMYAVNRMETTAKIKRLTMVQIQEATQKDKNLQRAIQEIAENKQKKTRRGDLVVYWKIEGTETEELDHEYLKKLESIREQLSVVDGVLIKTSCGTKKFVVPKSLINTALDVAHDSHGGVAQMSRVLRRSLWWPNMTMDIVKRRGSCVACDIVSKADPPEEMKRTQIPSEPNSSIAVDFWDANVISFSVLVIVDVTSRYVTLKFLRDGRLHILHILLFYVKLVIYL
jgi:hypothetical protein